MATGGGGNIAIGAAVMAKLPNAGNSNTAVGHQAMYAANHANADQNTIIGYTAGYALTSGNKNTFVGNESVSTVLTTGDKNTVIGSESTVSTADAQNQISLGQGITGQSDDTAIIGNSDIGDVYMSQDAQATVRLGNILFDAQASGNANNLDDYEEGQWTPAPSGGGIGIDTIYDARYTKIGRVVVITCYIDVNTGGGGSALSISGFPFTNAADSLATGTVMHLGSAGATHLRMDGNATAATVRDGSGDAINGSEVGSATFAFQVTYMTAPSYS